MKYLVGIALCLILCGLAWGEGDAPPVEPAMPAIGSGYSICNVVYHGVPNDSTAGAGALIDALIDSMIGGSYVWNTFYFNGGTGDTGIYQGNWNNYRSDVTFIFQAGARFDGVIHLAFGDTSLANDTGYVRNVQVIGDIVSYTRIGAAAVDGLYCSGRWIIDSAGDSASGVHLYYGCRNVWIPAIEVWATDGWYGLSIDGISATSAHKPEDIHIGEVLIKGDTFQAVVLAYANRLTFKNITIEQYDSSHGFYALGVNDLGIYGKLFVDGAGQDSADNNCVWMTACTSVYIAETELEESGSIGLFVDGCLDVVMGKVKISRTDYIAYWLSGSERVYIYELVIDSSEYGIRLWASDHCGIWNGNIACCSVAVLMDDSSAYECANFSYATMFIDNDTLGGCSFRTGDSATDSNFTYTGATFPQLSGISGPLMNQTDVPIRFDSLGQAIIIDEKMTVEGVGFITADDTITTDTSELGASITLMDKGTTGDRGGVVFFGNNEKRWAAIKAELYTAAGNYQGDLSFFTRINSAHTYLSRAMHLTVEGNLSLDGHRVIGAAPPINDSDVVTLQYGDAHYAATGGTSDSTGVDTGGVAGVDNYLYPTYLKEGTDIVFTVTGDTLMIAGPSGSGTIDSFYVIFTDSASAASGNSHVNGFITPGDTLYVDTTDEAGGTSDSLGIDTDGNGTVDAYLYSTVAGCAHIKKGSNITLTVAGDTVTISGDAAAGTADSIGVDTTADGTVDAYLYSTVAGCAHIKKGGNITLSVSGDTLTISSTAGSGAGGWVDDGAYIRLETVGDSVGIGTATPSEKLDVVGNVEVTGTIGASGVITGSSFSGSGITGATDLTLEASSGDLNLLSTGDIVSWTLLNMSSSFFISGDTFSDLTGPSLACSSGVLIVADNSITGTKIPTNAVGADELDGVGVEAELENVLDITDMTETADRIFYSDVSGNITGLALGTSGQYLKSLGLGSAPVWDAPPGLMNWTDSTGFLVGWGGVAKTVVMDTNYFRFEGGADFDTTLGVVSLADNCVQAAELDATAVESELEGVLDHDQLQGVDPDEHRNWTADQGATNIHSGNYENTQLSEEQIEDYAGGMVTGGTETRITVTYTDGGVGAGVFNFVVDDPDTSLVLSEAYGGADKVYWLSDTLFTIVNVGLGETLRTYHDGTDWVFDAGGGLTKLDSLLIGGRFYLVMGTDTVSFPGAACLDDQFLRFDSAADSFYCADVPSGWNWADSSGEPPFWTDSATYATEAADADTAGTKLRAGLNTRLKLSGGTMTGSIVGVDSLNLDSGLYISDDITITGTVDGVDLSVFAATLDEDAEVATEAEVGDSLDNYFDTAAAVDTMQALLAVDAITDAFFIGKIEVVGNIEHWDWMWTLGEEGMWAANADTNETWFVSDSSWRTATVPQAYKDSLAYAGGHPDHIHIPGGFLGKYPDIYVSSPLDDSLFESIIIYGSRDGGDSMEWIVNGTDTMNGLLMPNVSLQSDGDLLFTSNGRLLCICRSHKTVVATSTIDGINWTSYDGLQECDTILDSAGIGYGISPYSDTVGPQFLSPSISMLSDTEYVIYASERNQWAGSGNDSSNSIVRYVSSNYYTGWTLDDTVNFEHPSQAANHSADSVDMWHHKIKYLSRHVAYGLMYCAGGGSGSGSPNGLWMAKTVDGGDTWYWLNDSLLVLGIGTPGLPFDHHHLYRATWVWEQSGSGIDMDVHYGCYGPGAGNNGHWWIGRTMIHLDGTDYLSIRDTGLVADTGIATKGWVRDTLGVKSLTIDSNTITNDALSSDDINWEIGWAYFDVPYVVADSTDSVFVSFPTRYGTGAQVDTTWLFTCSLGASATGIETLSVVTDIPYSCTIDTLQICYRVSTGSEIDWIKFFGPDISEGFNLTDSFYWQYGTDLTSISWAIATIDISAVGTNISAAAGDRYSVRFQIDLDASNDRLHVAWIRARLVR